MATEIRRLTIDDYNDILRVWADAGLEHRPLGRDSRAMIAKEMQFPGAAYFGYFDNGRMIGTVIANFDGRRGWINRLAVKIRGSNKRIIRWNTVIRLPLGICPNGGMRIRFQTARTFIDINPQNRTKEVLVDTL